MIICVPKSNYLARALVNHVFCGPGSQNPQSAFPQPSSHFTLRSSQLPSTSSGGELRSSLVATTGLSETSRLEYRRDNFKQLLCIVPSSLCKLGTLVSFGVYDAPTAGNLLFFDSLLVPVSVGAGSRCHSTRNSDC